MSNDQKPRRLTVERQEGESDEAAWARAFLSPAVQSALSVSQLTGESFPGIELSGLVDALECQVSGVRSSGRAESLLMSQAQTLDAIFHATLRRAVVIMGDYPEVVEMYLKLALKAQSQCQATLESLERLGKCSVSINQANIAHGPQQINNISENELLESNRGEWLDGRAPETTIRDDQELEAVGAIDRSQDDGRKAKELEELG